MKNILKSPKKIFTTSMVSKIVKMIINDESLSL
jgi:hypothetical protein